VTRDRASLACGVDGGDIGTRRRPNWPEIDAGVLDHNVKEVCMRVVSVCLALGLSIVLAGCTDAADLALANGVAREPIIGGQPDSTSHNVVGILTREGELCSGSLILPNLVLTARHCVAAISGGGESVQCGVSTFGSVKAASDFVVSWDDNLRDNIDSSSVFHVSTVKVPTDSGVCGNDIALLELSSNVPASQATPLEPRVDSPPANNETFAAVGYGLTNPNDMAGTTAGKRMRFDGAHVSCVGSACRSLGAVANEWGAQSPVCSGDSGGPAIDSAGRVMGATSRGPSDCSSAVYSGVNTWKSFIVGAATTAAKDGGYTPPGWVTGTSTADGGTQVPDGGASNDAGITDAGGPSDAGTPLSDAGVPNDAGITVPDAGVPSDAGAPMADGGTPNDAGLSVPDAGVPSDAGLRQPEGGTMASDAGVSAPDGGTHATDAGARPSDAGIVMLTDAGAAGRGPGHMAPIVDSGCGCRTTPGAPSRAWPLFLAAIVAALGRRRSRRRPS
jgi:MYXO-CTERM domain-containing protein